MGKKIFNKINDRLENGLRGLLGRLTPDLRVILIASMFVLFSALSIYMTVSSIYNFGKDKGRQLEIERIEGVKIQWEEAHRDSINQLNNFHNGTGEFE